MKDLFETPELIPDNVREILNKYECGDEIEYSELEKMLLELNEIGYTFDYYLDAVPYFLRAINQ